AVNEPPTANADAASTNEDTSVDINVLPNDVVSADTLNPVLRVSAITESHGGTAVVNPNGTVRFTPSANLNSGNPPPGGFGFSYTVYDGVWSRHPGVHLSDSAPAAVSITVIPVNDDPSATTQGATTSEDTPKAITLSGAEL